MRVQLTATKGVSSFEGKKTNQGFDAKAQHSETTTVSCYTGSCKDSSGGCDDDAQDDDDRTKKSSNSNQEEKLIDDETFSSDKNDEDGNWAEKKWKSVLWKIRWALMQEREGWAGGEERSSEDGEGDELDADLHLESGGSLCRGREEEDNLRRKDYHGDERSNDDVHYQDLVCREDGYVGPHGDECLQSLQGAPEEDDDDDDDDIGQSLDFQTVDVVNRWKSALLKTLNADKSGKKRSLLSTIVCKVSRQRDASLLGTNNELRQLKSDLQCKGDGDTVLEYDSSWLRVGMGMGA